MPCGGPKKSPRTSSIVQIIFSFWSFDIREGSLRNQKIINGLDSFSKQHLIFWPHLVYTSLCNELQNYSNSPWIHVAKSIGSLKRLWWFFLFYVLVFKIFLCCWRLMYVCIF